MGLARNLLPAAILCAVCGGCSNIEDLTVAPGNFYYYNCEQMAIKGRDAAKRERELKLLIDKAMQSPGGELVSALAYRNEYVTATAELKQLEAAAVQQNCPTPWRSVSDRSMW